MGIVAAEALAEAGARCVVLASRSGEVKYSNQGLIERLEVLRQSGVTVVVHKCDMGDESQVKTMLDRVRAAHDPIRVVVHAAGVVSDALLAKQDVASMQRVFSAKANGAWYLHKHTMQDELQTFLVFSSTAVCFESPGQSNYAAANAYLDELGRHRHAKGLPGVSIQWPAVMGVGMAAAMDESIRVDSSECVDARTVKQVLHQLLDPNEFPEMANPVRAVVPRSILETFVSVPGRPTTKVHYLAPRNLFISLTFVAILFVCMVC